MRVLGIDPGSIKTGFGIIEVKNNHYSIIKSGVIRTLPSDKNFSNRLKIIYDNIKSLILDHRPDIVGIEKVFFAKNSQSALKLGQARGAAMTAAASLGLQVEELSPLEVKQAVVGFGRASKDQVQKMVKILLSMKEMPLSDEADALAIAIALLNSHQLKTKLGHYYDRKTEGNISG